MHDWYAIALKDGHFDLAAGSIINRVIFTNEETVDENYLLFVLRYGEVDYVDSAAKKPELTGLGIT